VKIGIEIDWQRRRFDVNRSRLQLADRLGYDMVFCAEAHGSDALTPLGYALAATERIGVGTRIAQNTSRSAPAPAMAFQKLGHMAGPDREIIAGLGTPRWRGRVACDWPAGAASAHCLPRTEGAAQAAGRHG
jgi:hypothetical protein